MRYLLDTNVIAEPTKPQPNQQVLNRFTQLAEEVAISSISWHELCLVLIVFRPHENGKT